ncbi:MAG: hypothetical protein KJ047_15315 [Anaerolineae bacterium]|nr:hypothetical protein [Anaerolineae bacterium]MEB2287742.1 hypothetical protein [Anaerolineae bacterium]
MKSMLFTATNWLVCDPRRIVTVTLVVLTVLAVALAVVPGTPALALEITSGS